MHVQQLIISQQYIRESQQVPGFKIESCILAPFPNTLTFSGGYLAKIVLNKVKKIIKCLETHAIAGKINASYIFIK